MIKGHQPDSLAQRSEDAWFASLPLALAWEDFSEVATRFDDLRTDGVIDIVEYFEANQDDLDATICLVRVVAVNHALCELRGAEDGSVLLGSVTPDRVDQQFRESMLRQLQALWEGRNTLNYATFARDGEHRQRDVVLYWSIPEVDGVLDPSKVLVALSDVTESVQSRRHLERSAIRRTTLYEIGVDLASTLDLDASLELILDSGRRLLSCDLAVLFTLDHSIEAITARLIAGGPQTVLEPFTYQELIDGLVGQAISTGGLIVRHGDQRIERRGALGAALRSAGINGINIASMALVPIEGPGSTTGVLAAGNLDVNNQFSSVDLDDLRLLGGQASVALQRTASHQETVRARDSLQETLDVLKTTQDSLIEAQKMESIGVLAAGVAHEINTPVQFIGDNVAFLAETFGEIMAAISAAKADLQGDDAAASAASAMQRFNQIDIDYLLEDVPLALEQTAEGIDRVATTVRALKEYSHPGSKQRSLIDIGKTLNTITTVTRSEWRTSATVEVVVDAGTPAVWALGNDLHQVFLNLIVNAVHAIRERWGPQAAASGRIEVSAEPWRDGVEVRVSDNGAGIPKAVHDRIFDQFFTTKAVGTGSGQGLTLAYRAIVQQHRGTLTFETEPGSGTTFVIRLPQGSPEVQDEH